MSAGQSGLRGAVGAMFALSICLSSPAFSQDDLTVSEGADETEVESESVSDEERAERIERIRERAQGEERDSTADWMPSGSVSWGVYTQSIDATTTASETSLSPATGDSYISTGFQFDGKLHTPLQFDVPSKPRLFLTAGFMIPLSKELIAARTDSEFDRDEDDPTADPPITDFADNCPDTIPLPDPIPVPGLSNEPTTCSLSIRNRVTIDAMWFAGFGFDFTLPIFDEQFHLSPAIEYYGIAAHTVGDFSRSSSGFLLNDLREQANAVGDSEVYHGISPSLAGSVDLYEDGPWRWSMFVQARVIFFLTDPLTKTSSSLRTNRITFVSDLDDFAVQAMGGITLQWTGKRR